MTTDERLEAIRQKIELRTSSRANEALSTDSEQQAPSPFAELAARFAETRGFIDRLARIAEPHG